MTAFPTAAMADNASQPDPTRVDSAGAAGQGGSTYTIAELAREFDITPRAIRFYEDQGLLSPARVGSGGRQRVYNGRQRTRLRLTLRGKRLGLTLNEIREILDLYESPRDTAPQLERFLASLAQHRQVLERQMEDLQAQLAEIDQHERQCQALLEQHARAGAPGAEGRPETSRVR